MSNATTTKQIMLWFKPERVYASSVLRIARHFWKVRSDTRVLELADELQLHPEAPVVGICDPDGLVVGLVRRDHLFSVLGKPFAREVLQRTPVTEIMESVIPIDAHADIFTVAQQVLTEMADDDIGYFALRDADGRFSGIVSSQDVANHLSRITQDDIELASRLQNRLLAGNNLTQSAGYRTEAWSRAARGVGGDFYFTRPLDGGRVFCALCDVSGKGVAASIIVSMVWGMLRMYDFKRGLPDLLVNLNASIIATFHMEKYLTGFFMIYDPSVRKLVCADMGHSHVLLLRDEKAYFVRTERMNLPIGVEAEIEPAVQTYRLAGDDGVLVYSDGLTEQQNKEGLEFGESRLIGAALRARKNGGLLEDRLPAAVDAFRGLTPQQDDMSFLLLTAADSPV